LLEREELSLYEEYLEPSETRFSKTNIFVNYKEFHNRRNIQAVPRDDKKHFSKQMRIINKEKQIDKRMPCWASDVDLIRKVQVIQNKLVERGLLDDNLQFAREDQKREFLRPKVEQLCKLMDQEYQLNVAKIRKQREEQKKHIALKPKQNPQTGSRSAQLAAGYSFSNPALLNKFK